MLSLLPKFLKMGRLKRFNLNKLAGLTGASYFFETGTWKGDGLAYAGKQQFKKIFSSEIIPSIAETATRRFENDSRITIINDSSVNSLKQCINQLDGNCIFWLDAHFPGAEERLKGYNETSDEEVKLPLEKELEVIASRKNKYADIILVDDLRIYETGPFASGNLPDNVLPPEVRTIDFAYRFFNDTHDIHKSFEDEGYLYLIPKKVFPTSSLKQILFKAQNAVFKRII
jgi:hypothetical protein